MGYCKAYKIIEQLKITQMFTLFQSYFQEGYFFPGEYHDFWECVYVISGNICASGDQRVYTLNAGDIIFHKPMEFHKFHVESPEGARLFIFTFSLQGNLCDSLKNSVFSLKESQDYYLKEFIGHLEKNASITQKFSCNHHDYMKQFYHSATFSQMIANILERFFLMLCEDGISLNTLVTPDTMEFRKIVTFMQEHIYENLSVDDIASQCCFSATTLKRIFSKYAGMSVHKYYVLLKINRATLLLQEGTSVTETAHILGFSDQAYFSKVFKKHTGISPSQCARL